MHEASLAQGLLTTIEKALAEHEASFQTRAPLKVREIICEIGLLSCVEANALTACFEIFAEGTACSKALLKIETEPLECACRDCDNNFILLQRLFKCPNCGSENINFQGGLGLTLKSLNVEAEEVENG